MDTRTAIRNANRVRVVGGVIPSSTEPFPYAEDRIRALEAIVREMVKGRVETWATGDVEHALGPDHAQLLRSVLDTPV